MKELTRTKRLEVSQYYLLGYTYKEIEEETGASHGSIANIVSEIENGILTIPGTPFDQVNDLRQLSSDLRKRGIEPSQALLGILFFDRLRALGVTPEHLDTWSELIKELTSPDFPVKVFFEAAMRLRELEESQGKRFESLTSEYTRLSQGMEELKQEIDSLSKEKSELIEKVKPLSSQVGSMKRMKEKLENDVEIQTARVQETKSKVKEAEEERARLYREIEEFKKRKAKLCSEVEGKEESIGRLNGIGLSDEDLMQLRNFFEKLSENERISTDQVKERFYTTLSLFKDISGLEKKREAEVQKIRGLTEEKSILNGEILKLQARKGILQGEIEDSVYSTSKMIRDIGEEATTLINQEVVDIKKQLNGLFEDTLRVGEAVGEMRKTVIKGEESGKSLENFLKEVRSRLETN